MANEPMSNARLGQIRKFGVEKLRSDLADAAMEWARVQANLDKIEMADHRGANLAVARVERAEIRLRDLAAKIEAVK